MKSSAIHALFAACALCSTACLGQSAWEPYGEIRVVRRTQVGGELALLGDREVAMRQAGQTMAMTCGGPGRYQIIEEGETVIGEESVSELSERPEKDSYGREKLDFFGPEMRDFSGPETRRLERTHTTHKTEWRVRYECSWPAQG
ncbi:hypothetical protein WME79_07800 [Sorangium sp. So ce726]|uniref:hypothetical protein n=1 Tax=Sorangium sp. So ce726 TaxID=3133319 RepID=UPI003F5FC5C7